MAARDADRAKALLAPGYDGNGTANTALLDSLVLRDSGYHPPRDLHLEPVFRESPGPIGQPTSGDAIVRVRYTVADRQYRTHELRLIPHNGSEPTDRWRITNPLMSLEVSWDTGTPTVAGRLLRNTKEIVYAFPGAYTAALAPQPFVSAEPVTLFAGSPGLVPFEPTVTDAALAKVEQQVRRYVDSCVRGEIKAAYCPFWDSTNLYTRPIAARIIKYPTLRIEVGGFGELSVSSAQPGEYEYTPRTSGSEPRRATRPFGVGGWVRVDGATIVFTRL